MVQSRQAGPATCPPRPNEYNMRQERNITSDRNMAVSSDPVFSPYCAQYDSEPLTHQDKQDSLKKNGG